MTIDKFKTKLILFLLTLSVIFWIGGSIYRAIIAYTLFEPFSLIIKSELTYETLRQTLVLIGNINVYLIISYPLTLILTVLFLKFSRVNLKNEGWLFMTILILAIFFPVEVYLSYLDTNYAIMVLLSEFDTNQALSLLIQRISALGGLPAIGFLCYLTIFWLIAFKPLKRKLNYESEGERVSVTAG